MLEPRGAFAPVFFAASFAAARAIAGTLNIVTREGFKKWLSDLRIGAGFEHERLMPGGSWTRNDVLGPLVYNLSLSAVRQAVEAARR